MHHIELGNLARLCAEVGRQVPFVEFGCVLGIQFGLYAMNVRGWVGRGLQPILIGELEVAHGIGRGHAPLVHPEQVDFAPIDLGAPEKLVHGLGRGTA